MCDKFLSPQILQYPHFKQNNCDNLNMTNYFEKTFDEYKTGFASQGDFERIC